MRRRRFLQLTPVPLLRHPRGRSCIVLRLTGGPSHLDTWDPKPGAPREIRGPFRAIRTNVPGIEISELFPRMAKHADKYALIRSVYDDAPPAHRPLPFPAGIPAASFSAALRQVEAGAPLVTVDMFSTVFDENTWDLHGWKPFASFTNYRDFVAPLFDRDYTSLLEQLAARGLLNTTLVVAAGEFGRTPKINPSGGRDHWTKCWTILMAGGGVRGGQIYGSSDKIGAEPRDNPVTLAMVNATIHQVMGIVPQNGAQPIAALFT